MKYDMKFCYGTYTTQNLIRSVGFQFEDPRTYEFHREYLLRLGTNYCKKLDQHLPHGGN